MSASSKKWLLLLPLLATGFYAQAVMKPLERLMSQKRTSDIDLLLKSYPHKKPSDEQIKEFKRQYIKNLTPLPIILQNEDPILREIAVYVSSSLSDRRIRALENTLHDPVPEVRMASLVVLSDRLEQPWVRQGLLERLSDSDDRVRQLTALALTPATFHFDVRKKLRDLLSDPKPVVSWIAGMVLLPVTAENSETKQKILDILRAVDPTKKRETQLEWTAFEALPVYKSILRFLSDPNPAVRKTAVVIFGGAKTPHIETALANLSLDPYPEVRQAVENWNSILRSSGKEATDPCKTAARGSP